MPSTTVAWVRSSTISGTYALADPTQCCSARPQGYRPWRAEAWYHLGYARFQSVLTRQRRRSGA